MTTLNDAWLDEFERFGPVSRTLSYLIRPALVAPEGKMLVWADWSAIEARVLPWLAGSRGGEKVLDIFRGNDADANAPDIYMIEAANIYGMAPLDIPRKGDERQIGKVAVLSLGFGGAVGALLAMATGYGIYMSETQAMEIVQKWRANNPWARNFWDQLWEAALTAINEPGTIRTAGRVAYTYDPGYLGGSLFCALPCGRLLTYPTIRWEDREVENRTTGKMEMKRQLTYRRGYGRAALWYGKFAENVTQAFAGSLLRHKLVRLRAHEDTMPVVAHTHDEIVTETEDTPEAVEQAKHTLLALMTENEDWNAGLPLAAEASSLDFYSKAA